MEENRWGTVFMGPTSDRESRLDKINNREEQDLWNRRTEAEYLRRVKERAVEQLNAMLVEAQEQAAGLLAAANADADSIREKAEGLRAEAAKDRKAAAEELAEAERIRQEAFDEGYGRGVEQAMMELDEQREKIDATTLSVLKAMEGQCGGLFDSWKEELTALVRQSVETGLGWTLKEDRVEVLDSLLGKSLEMLENHKRIVVRANPEDAPAVEEVLAGARRRFNELKTWDVQPDETMAPGGLVVESTSGKVETRAETRREIVEQALRHLTLPQAEADTQAKEAVHKAAEQAGIPALEAAVEGATQKALDRAAARAALEAADKEAHDKVVQAAKAAEDPAPAEPSDAPKPAATPEASGVENPSDQTGETPAVEQEGEQPEQPAIPPVKQGKALPAAEPDPAAQNVAAEAAAAGAVAAAAVAAESALDIAADAGPQPDIAEAVEPVEPGVPEGFPSPEDMAPDLPEELARLLAGGDDDPDGEEFDKFLQESMDSVRAAGGES